MVKRGFTIFEVLVVVIIVSVMASLAIPRMYNIVELSRASEAIGNIQMIRTAIERCYFWQEDYSACSYSPPDPTNLIIDDPGDDPGSHFTYEANANPLWYWIRATRNGLDGDKYEGSRITYTYSTPAHSQNFSKRLGDGPYKSLTTPDYF